VKLLITSLPRTGSSKLLTEISKKYNLNGIFEPYNIMVLNKETYSRNMVDVAVKTIIGQTPKLIQYDIESEEYTNQYLNWYYEFILDFDKIILLSRKDLIACIESISFLMYNYDKKNFNYYSQYFYEKPPKEIYDIFEKEIRVYDKIINILSKELNIPITYYEDIYDLNSPDRLRKGNKITGKKII
jgi:hypothetical protein